MVLVEQDVKRSLKVADYAYVLQEGKVRLAGRPLRFSEDAVKKAYFGLPFVGPGRRADPWVLKVRYQNFDKGGTRISGRRSNGAAKADFRRGSTGVMLAYVEAFINGALLGGLYAVIGIGLSMVFGIMKQLNLAHGELMILACYFSL